MRNWILLLVAALIGGEAYAQHAERRQSISRNEQNTFWQWSGEKPYHAAAVRVSGPGGAGGSGTLVGTTGNATLCVTNHHVVQIGNSINVAHAIKVYLLNGQELIATHLMATPVEDVAVYVINRKDLPAVAVGSEDPPPGALVDTMGFGGPWHHRNAFRPFLAKTTQTNKAIAVDAPVISGDSGAGMIWENVLVGVNWGADAKPIASAGVNTGSSVALVYPATSSANTGFLQRFLTQACNGIGCAPIIGRPGYLIPRADQKWERMPRTLPGQQFPGPEQFYPPANPQPVIPQPVPDPVPNQPPANTQPLEPVTSMSPVDLQRVSDIVSLNLKSDAAFQMELIGPRGEKGERGDCGATGPVGPKGDPGEVTAEHLSIIAMEVRKSLASDPSMRGKDGRDGVDGRDGKDAVVDIDAIAEAVIARMPGIRVVLVDGETKQKIDDETFAVGEALVLDINKLIRSR